MMTDSLDVLGRYLAALPDSIPKRRADDALARLAARIAELEADGAAMSAELETCCPARFDPVVGGECVDSKPCPRLAELEAVREAAMQVRGHVMCRDRWLIDVALPACGDCPGCRFLAALSPPTPDGGQNDG